MHKSEVEEQSKALQDFIASMRRPVMRWPWRAKEPKAHREWLRLASSVRRFELYRAAGLELLPGMTKAFFDIETRERIAWRRWLAYKHRREMRYCTGKTQSAPPWDF